MDQTVKRAPRGFGRIMRHRTAGTWFIAFYSNGREVRESVAKLTGKPPSVCTDVDARRALKKRMKEIFGAKYRGPDAERMTVADVMDIYAGHIELKEAKSIRTLRIHIAQIKDELGHIPVRALDTARAERWMRELLGEAYAPASVNAIISTLKAALNYAVKAGRIAGVPYIPLLRLHNARQGFFERPDVERVIAELEDPLNDVVRFAYLTGWRKGEILSLTWPQVDRVGAVITLTDTKNGQGRVIPMLGDIAALVEIRWALKLDQCPYVFHRRGRPITSSDWYWQKACERAGVEGRLFHDLRRTAVRDMIRAGVPEHIAMQISGHRSTAVFRRYNIVDDRDRRAALMHLESYRAAQQDADTTRTPDPVMYGRNGVKG